MAALSRLRKSARSFARIKSQMSEFGAIPISRSKSDPLYQFCNELNTPLEEIFSLIYLATHVTGQPDSEEHLKRALERLAKVRRVVLSHCDGPEERRWAS